MERRFPWGGVELMLTLKNGKVERAAIYTDSMDENLSDKLRDALEGAEYGRAMTDRLGFNPDIQDWLNGELPV